MSDAALASDRGNLRGALCLAAAALVFTVEVAVVRLLDGAASNAQIVFFRALMQLVFAALLVALVAPRLARTAKPGPMVVRGLTSLACWWFYYQSFQALGLALATVLTFTSSLFVVALAPLVLGERVGPRRWAATICGFLGVVLAAGAAQAPGAGWGVIAGLLAAAAAAALIFQNRVLARTEHSLTIMLWIGGIAVLGTLPPALGAWHGLPGWGYGVLIATGSLGTLGMWLTIEAYRWGEVSALAPFPYLRLVFALVLGLALFGEWPTPAALAGAGMIVAGALITTRRSAGMLGR